MLPIRKVLISEPVDQACVEILLKNGIEVSSKPGITKEKLIDEIKNYDGLVVRSATKVTAEILDAGAGNLKIVGRAGTGVDNIDCDAATRNGVLVINAPGGNTLSAAELTCSMILSLSRSIPQACASMKEGRWDRKNFMGQELQNKTLAIIGLGRIGREVATRMQSFGMKTIGFDPLVPAEASREFGVESFGLEQLWPQADYITIHVPLIPQTKNMINSQVFAKCRKGVFIINCARGGIIDESALLQALESGHCGGLGVDVYEQEPPTNKPLIQHPKVICTPHLGASTKEAQRRVAEEIAEQFVDLINGRPIFGAVNAPILSFLLNPENQPWMAVSERMTKIAVSLMGSEPVSRITLHTYGDILRGKEKALMTASMVGALSSIYKNVNFINAPSFAKEKNLQIEHTHESKLPCCSDTLAAAVIIKVVSTAGKSVSVCGTTQGAVPLLCGVENALFHPQFHLTGKILVCRMDEKCNIVELIQKGQVRAMAMSNSEHGPQWCLANLSANASIEAAALPESCILLSL